ncbi:hypothetical protein [Demequina gelatinilytica]|uniref:hypothetical protein n=1 Tax=Demequina gelatinilytica TaxID=1638980 RepID=UPI0007865397|nr:hypothetical protein [Demequina gelatinilytica]
MRAKMPVAVAALLLVAGCSTNAEDADAAATPTGAATEVVATVEPTGMATADASGTDDGASPAPAGDEDWAGEDSPVLAMTADEREALIDPDLYARFEGALADSVEGEAATAAEDALTAFLVAEGGDLTRLQREVLLLASLEGLDLGIAATPEMEAAALTGAWDTCRTIEEGTPVEDVLEEAFTDLMMGAAFSGLDEDATDAEVEAQVGVATSQLMGTMLAFTVCPEHSDALITGIDGMDFAS